MIGQGLTLTVIGMAIVIFFLSLLVVMMVIMSRLVGRVERRRAEKAEAPGDTAMPELPAELPKAPDQPAAEEDNSEIAAALGAYLRAGGVLPAATGDEREDVAAVLAAVAAAGGPVAQGNQREIAAAIAAISSRR